MKITFSNIILLLLLAIVSILSFSRTNFCSAQITVSQEFTDAIDAAVQQILVDKTFTTKYEELMSFPVPLCGQSAINFPATNPFVGRKNLNMCFEDDAVYPFSEVFHMVGQKIVEKVNSNYKINLSYAYRTYNLAALGFFETMVKAINAGECD